MQAMKRLQAGLYNVEIWPDPNPPHPREWDNAGTLALWKHCGHQFGDESRTTDGLRDLVDDPNVLALPVYAQERDGLSVSTRPYSDWWDSGYIGVICINVTDALKRWDKTEMTDELRREVLAELDGEIRTLDDYLQGNVYGFRIFDPEGAEVAAEWGFFDLEWCEEEAMQQAEREIATAQILRRAAWRQALAEARRAIGPREAS